MDQKGDAGWEAEVATGRGGRVTPTTPERGPRGSRRPGCPSARNGGGGSCQRMRRCSRAAAAAAFIFKLPSGQRARRGRGPRPAGWPPPRPSRGPATSPHLASAWLPAYLGVRRHLALHVGHSPWLRRHRGSWGLSGGGGRGQRPGQGSRGASRPALPGGQDSEAGALRRRSGLPRLVACEARSRRPPSVFQLRPRSRSLPGAGPVPAAAQPYCTARAAPSLPAGAYQVRHGEDLSPPASGMRAAARPPRSPRPPPPRSAGPRARDASPATATEGTPWFPEDARAAASPCGRALVRATAPADYVGSALVTHPRLGLGGVEGSGSGNLHSHPGTWGLRLRNLGGSFKSRFSPNPTSNQICPGRCRET